MFTFSFPVVEMLSQKEWLICGNKAKGSFEYFMILVDE